MTDSKRNINLKIRDKLINEELKVNWDFSELAGSAIEKKREFIKNNGTVIIKEFINIKNNENIDKIVFWSLGKKNE